MFRWLKQFFWPEQPSRPRFQFPPRESSLPPCRIRPSEKADFPACAEIYRLNESIHFPTGYFEEFSSSFRSRRSLFLICEVEGNIRGFGGICFLQYPAAPPVVSLNFGMIHPAHHKQGFGTALLLARLATLPQSESPHMLFLSSAGTSATFYPRFGFTPAGSYSDEYGHQHDSYFTEIHLHDWHHCRRVLGTHSITLDTAKATVPLRDPPEQRTPSSPL